MVNIDIFRDDPQGYRGEFGIEVCVLSSKYLGWKFKKRESVNDVNRLTE